MHVTKYYSAIFNNMDGPWGALYDKTSQTERKIPVISLIYESTITEVI